MKAIFKKDNIYVAVDRICPDEDKVRGDAQLILESKSTAILYGGRVQISNSNYSNIYLLIDGIKIEIPKYNTSMKTHYTTGELSYCECVAYLNQIEQLGVDTFLDNYKKVIKEYRTEIEKQIGDLQNELSLEDDKDKKHQLKKLQEVFNELSCLLVALYINLNAGLDNFTYIDAYDSIINQFF